jgi:hypothetical protein
VAPSAQVQKGNFTGCQPEFGRHQDLNRIFGIRRGTAYNLLLDGKIKGVLLRIRGQKSGIRLFDLGSVREFIRRSTEEGGENPAKLLHPRKSPRTFKGLPK